MFGFLKRRSQALPAPPKTLQVGTLPVLVQRKPIRSLRLSITPSGQARLSAPRRVSEAQLKAFVESKLSWIRRQQERVAAAGQEAPRDLAADRRSLEERLPGLITEWQPRLGVSVSAWRVRAMRTRWGSCNVRARRLSFSLGLAKHPPQCLDYIVVHEMMHLLEPGHGARFKALMQQHYPAWKACRDLLNGKDSHALHR